jgi:hypothetical protein
MTDPGDGIVSRFFARLMRIPYTPYLFLLVPLVVASLRLLLEHAVSPRWGTSRSITLDQLLEVYGGYLLLHLSLAVAFGLAASRPARDFVGVVAVGLVLAWLAPLLDLLLPEQAGLYYQYSSRFSWSFVGETQPLGEVVSLWVAIFASALFILWLTRSPWRALLAAALAWVALQIFMWGHYALAELLSSVVDGGAPRADILVTAVAALAMVVAVSPSIRPSVARANHALPFFAVAALGARLAGAAWPEAILRGAVMGLAFVLVIIANDYFDRDDDASAGGEARPARHEDAVVALAYHLLLFAWVAATDAAAVVPLALFFVAWLAYHHPALRFKRLFCLGYKIEGVSAACCFLYGTQARPPIELELWRILFAGLLVGGFALGSSFKDYKDIAQDRAAAVGTIYTRYLARGYDLAAIHTFVVFSLAVVLLVPVVWLGVRGAPLWVAVGLGLAALVPSGLLRSMASPRSAVEAAMWALGGFLMLLAVAAPRLSVTPSNLAAPSVTPPSGRGTALYRLAQGCSDDGGAHLSVDAACTTRCCRRDVTICVAWRDCRGGCTASGARVCPNAFLGEISER